MDAIRADRAIAPLGLRAAAAVRSTATVDGKANRATNARAIHNAPVLLTSLIGRGREILEVQSLLAASRLVTLTGAGGVGKTRLALAVAAEVVSLYQDGVWFVDLAALTDAGLLPEAVAFALDVRQQPGSTPLEALTTALCGQQCLLILDNCEHLVGACQALTDRLLHTCSHLRVLATSRERLGIMGETSWRVPSLKLPESPAEALIERLGQAESVRLFLDRAQAVQPGLALTPANAPTIADLCCQLDGIPLAIELAAARANVLSVEQIVERLTDRFRLLTGGSRTAPLRQQTLRATLDWSHGLLGELERVLFRRLAVFSGTWTLEAVEAVCTGDGLDRGAVLDLLSSLADKSLVSVDTAARGSMRYRLLETVRQYAAEKLDAAGEERTFGGRHAEWYLALAESAHPDLIGPRQQDRMERLELEYDNLRAALEWSLQNPEGGTVALRLAGALSPFWWRRGRLGEGRTWTARALKIGKGPEAQAPTVERTRALTGAAALARAQGDYATARSLLEESLRLSRDLHDSRGIATCLQQLGFVALWQGDEADAVTLAHESLTWWRTLGDARGLCGSLGILADVARRQGAHSRATALYEEALPLARDVGDVWGIATIHAKLGALASEQGRHKPASHLLETSLQQLRELGDREGTAWVLGLLGRAARVRNDTRQARRRFEESLALFLELQETWGIADCLVGLAWTTKDAGRSEAAVRLLGAAQALCEVSGIQRLSGEAATYDGAVATLRAHLGDTAFAAAWADGRTMPLEQAILEAQQSLLVNPGSLTPRQLEVAVLVAEGLTNRLIAEQLVVTERAVAAHVEHILNKLGVGSRTQIAVWTSEHGLLAKRPD